MKGLFPFNLPIDPEEINMANSVFMKPEAVQELLGVSRPESYRIIKKLNDDLKAKGVKEYPALLYQEDCPAHPDDSRFAGNT